MRKFSVGRMTLLLLLVSLQMACSQTPRKGHVPVGDASHTIYFIVDNWHTSILIEAAPLLNHSEKLALDFHDQSYIRVGWGDGDYFTGKSKRWTTAAKALIASDYSALQVLAYRHDPRHKIAAGTIVPLAITNDGMRELAAYVDESIAMNAQGNVIYLEPMTPNSNLFYQSTSHYSVVTNCNTWSSRALKRAGLPIKSTLKLTAQSVFSQAKQISLQQQEQQVFDQLAFTQSPP
jgi:uncharacterized protein (TIGR02117 family)